MATVPDLLAALASHRSASAEALRVELGLSPGALSRLLVDAGEQVCRIGRDHALQYARARSVERLGRSVPLFRVGSGGEVTAEGRLRLLGHGQSYWDRQEAGHLFAGLPPALAEMAPQGYLGHRFLVHNPELELPRRLADWSDDHRLVALAHRGEDCTGNLIAGDESLRRFLASRVEEVVPEDYPHLAGDDVPGPARPLAGGGRPRFCAFSAGRHVLVKFAPPGEAAGARRWRDLLWCEWKALETVASAGVPAVQARLHDVDGWRFLELERFDRVGARGRRAVHRLAAQDDLQGEGPVLVAAAAAPFRTPPSFQSRAEAARLRWLQAFSQAIGDTAHGHRHAVVVPAEGGRPVLAPAHGLLPRALAPAEDEAADRPLELSPPGADHLDVWPDASRWALRFWGEVQGNAGLEAGLRRSAGEAARALSALADRVGGG
jgi:hypothetical protein